MTARPGVAAGRLCLVLGLLVAPVAPPPTAATSTEAAQPEAQRVEDRVRMLLNEARRAHGLPPLPGDSQLDRLARQHSLEMARTGRVSHYSERYGLGTERRVRLAYPEVQDLAENVARNRSAERLHHGLISSPGHRRNRLDPDFTHVGVGVAFRGSHEIYLTEIFITAPRGTPLGAPEVIYTDLPPDSVERQEQPRATAEVDVFTVGGPGEDDPETWTLRGIRQFERGEYRAAARSFRKALDLQPGYTFARYNLARALLRHGRPGEAREVLEPLLTEDPDDMDARFTYGTASLLAAEYEAAESAFRRVLSRRPRDADAWYNLGLALEYRDRREAAVNAYAQAIHLDPEMEDARAALQRLRR